MARLTSSSDVFSDLTGYHTGVYFPSSLVPSAHRNAGDVIVYSNYSMSRDGELIRAIAASDPGCYNMIDTFFVTTNKALPSIVTGYQNDSYVMGYAPPLNPGWQAPEKVSYPASIETTYTLGSDDILRPTKRIVISHKGRIGKALLPTSMSSLLSLSHVTPEATVDEDGHSPRANIRHSMPPANDLLVNESLILAPFAVPRVGSGGQRSHLVRGGVRYSFGEGGLSYGEVPEGLDPYLCAVAATAAPLAYLLFQDMVYIGRNMQSIPSIMDGLSTSCFGECDSCKLAFIMKTDMDELAHCVTIGPTLGSIARRALLPRISELCLAHDDAGECVCCQMPSSPASSLAEYVGESGNPEEDGFSIRIPEYLPSSVYTGPPNPEEDSDSEPEFAGPHVKRPWVPSPSMESFPSNYKRVRIFAPSSP